MTIKERIQGLEMDDLVGQLLCYDIYEKDNPKEIEKIVAKIKPGGIFLTDMSPEKIKMYTDMVNKYVKIPVIVTSDIENGPETAIKGTGYLPQPMAWGAADDADLIEEAAKTVGNICRQNGVQWTYSPVIDINYNFKCCESNIRAISDSPDQVIKIAKAYIKGLQYNDNMIACCKHFPGQGMDERNSHFVTTVNSLSKEEWMETYGKVYKAFIDMGVPSIMVGHGCLPSVQEGESDGQGPLPAVLSRRLMTDFLKGELGFEGCIVSDAMSMVGVAARVSDIKELALRFINAGGDMVLFPEPTDHENLLQAVENGSLSKERLLDAVTRIIKVKEKARLFPDQEPVVAEYVSPTELVELSQKIADKSIKIVRNEKKILPLKLKKNAYILMINVLEPHFHGAPTGLEFNAMRDELQSYGYNVDVMVNVQFDTIQPIMDNYDAILVNCKMSSKDYHGGTLRMGWNQIMTFWRGYVLQHPNFVFTSFGDPYKLYDMPYLKEYINAFSSSEATQRAVAKVIVGKIEAMGKNPVSFKGFFEREV